MIETNPTPELIEAHRVACLKWVTKMCAPELVDSVRLRSFECDATTAEVTLDVRGMIVRAWAPTSWGPELVRWHVEYMGDL